MIARIFGFLLVSVLISGCSTAPKVTTDFNPSYNFANLKSFLLKDSQSEIRESILISPFTFNYIHDVLLSELSKKYQFGTEKTADFIVSYHIVMEEKLDPRVYDESFGFGYWGRGPRPSSSVFIRPAYTTNLSVYNQGTLIVDMVDAKTNQPIWRGVSEKRLSKGLMPQQQRDVLATALMDILAQFPPVK